MIIYKYNNININMMDKYNTKYKIRQYSNLNFNNFTITNAQHNK